MSKPKNGGLMCPACIATAALVVAGGSTAGGLGMLAVKKLQGGKSIKKTSTQSKSKKKSS